MRNHKILTGGGDLVQGPIGLVGGIARDVVTEPDGGQGDEAVVQRIQEVPFRLQVGEDRGRHQDEEHHERRHYRKT